MNVSLQKFCFRLSIFVALIYFGQQTTHAAAMETVTAGEARSIAKEAYLYGFPMVEAYKTLYAQAIDQGGANFKAPLNQIGNTASVFTPKDTAIITPNSDTPYSFVWMDLRAEPVILTLPEVEQNRYYSVQLIDLFTQNFAYLGKRTTGSKGGHFLIAGPAWHGEKPADVSEVVHCETEFAYALYRTQLFGPEDLDNVKHVQNGYQIQPLSAFVKRPAPASAAAVDWPKPNLATMTQTPAMFRYLDFLLSFAPTVQSETELMARFAKIGIGSKVTFNETTLSPDMRRALQDGIADGMKEFALFKANEIDTKKVSSADFFGTRDYLKNNYLYRYAGAKLGIFGNSGEEAIYPAYFVSADGEPLNGASNNYVLKFDPGQLPPANAFWSVTMYDGRTQLLVDNSINRYLINSPMLSQMKTDADGSLTLNIQHQSPGAAFESNWLPAPNGPFYVVMRIYMPMPEVRSGSWKEPPLVRMATANNLSQNSIPVTPDNFVRAESDLYFANIVKDGGFGKFLHRREPAAIDNQTIIRLNRDTLYSAAVFDLDAGPVAITLPDAGKRFMSMQVINEDQYTPQVNYGAGSYSLTKEKIGTRYVLIAIRTLVDPGDAKDVLAVHALQDAIKVDQPNGPGTFETPHWDQASQKKVRNALLVLASTLPDTKHMFGTKDVVDPVRRLIGAASAWGGNPEKDALYLNVTPSKNDGQTIYSLNVKDVPVDGFWSISVYNAQGYFEANPENAFTLNNITAKPDADGSINVQFGDCKAEIVNCLPITKGWNYLVRLYRPRAEILDGKWKFPEAHASN